jgi:hypothetical protein
LSYNTIGETLQRNWTALASAPLPIAPSNTTELPRNLGINAFHGIGCSDTANRADKPEDLYSDIRAQAAGESWGDIFGSQIWVYAQWPFQAKEQFKGPFAEIRAQVSIIQVHGKYGPITPVSWACEASANLEESRVLVH